MNGEGRASSIVKEKDKLLVLMCGYLPGALPQRSPISSPVVVRSDGFGWNDVCGGGCGFAMAISESGKLITWGSTDDLGQSYLTSGKHGEIPEPFPLPTGATLTKAAAGWAHCVATTGTIHLLLSVQSTDIGEVYTWGWKECIPSGKTLGEPSTPKSSEIDASERHGSFVLEQVNPCPQVAKSSGGSSGGDTRGMDESKKRRRLSAKQAAESSSSGDDLQSAMPCLVTLNPGVRIVNVAAGGRHTLVLSGILIFSKSSDIGQVWGWGYGGEGQLGLGSRIRMVSSPHPIPCIESSHGRDRPAATSRGGTISEGQSSRVLGNYIKAIACGGRHSVAITDAGVLLAFGWGLYGQCGQGSTDDELNPTCVSSLLGIRIAAIAAGLWHTVCISDDGDVYAFGGNQFGQLGTGTEQAEALPRLLDAPSLENETASILSCGARHSAVVTVDRKVFCWGWNKYGQLGLGDVIDRNVPCQLSMDGYIPSSVACGWWHTLLLAEPLD
ncbi:Ultraviolet-B receptor UVR8 [Linum perenne]